MNCKTGIMVLAAGLVGGCFSPDPKSLGSDSAASAVPAIKTAADNNDRAAIPRLVQDLDDHDSAIRFAAISALKRMTGQDLGFRYYDDEWDRRSAVQRWWQWLKDHPSR
jgi:HEAT repeat protein